MFNHPFAYVMIATFLGAVLAMLAGVAGLGGNPNDKESEINRANRSNKLMALRVGLCALLLAEILIYVNYLR